MLLVLQLSDEKRSPFRRFSLTPWFGNVRQTVLAPVHEVWMGLELQRSLGTGSCPIQRILGQPSIALAKHWKLQTSWLQAHCEFCLVLLQWSFQLLILSPSEVGPWWDARWRWTWIKPKPVENLNMMGWLGTKDFKTIDYTAAIMNCQQKKTRTSNHDCIRTHQTPLFFFNKIKVSLENEIDSLPFEFFTSFHHWSQIGIQQPKLIESQG